MRVLTCPPLYFEVLEENPSINPWMAKKHQPDKKEALKQWHSLIGTYWDMSVEVFTVEPQKGMGDMCFAANAAWGRDNMFVMANFHPDVWWRKGEVSHFVRWLTDHRFGVDFLPEEFSFEGQGSLATLKKYYIYGWGIRDSGEVPDYLEERFRIHRRIVPVELIDPRFYHLDVAFHFARGAAGVIWCPDAFDRQDIKRIERTIEKEGLENLELSLEEALQDKSNNRRNFLLNSVYIGNTEIMPWDKEFSEFPAKVRQFIESRGGRIITLDLSEFGVSGGGARCLSLFLD